MVRALSLPRLAWAVQPGYVVAEVVVAVTLGVSYSFSDDTISALGTTCPAAGTGCTDAGAVMNTVFIVFGALQVLGALPLLRSSAEGSGRVAGALWASAGGFSILVGLFPVDSQPLAHTLVALPVFVCQPAALLLQVRQRAPSAVRSMGVGLAVLSLAGTLAFALLLGATAGTGLAERAAIWPAKVWLALSLVGTSRPKR